MAGWAGALLRDPTLLPSPSSLRLPQQCPPASPSNLALGSLQASQKLCSPAPRARADGSAVPSFLLVEPGAPVGRGTRPPRASPLPRGRRAPRVRRGPWVAHAGVRALPARPQARCSTSRSFTVLTCEVGEAGGWACPQTQHLRGASTLPPSPSCSHFPPGLKRVQRGWLFPSTSLASRS